jgi:hypothetical protein
MQKITVYFQKFGGQLFGDFVFAAYEGFLHDRDADLYDLKFYTDIKTVEPDINTVVIGCVEDTEQYFRALGVEPPKALNVPEWMRHLTNRTYTVMKIEEFLENDMCPVFIKPVELKVFAGGVIQSDKNKALVLKDVPAGTDVVVSEVMDIVNEYRVFVLNGEVIGVKQYNQVNSFRDWFTFPSPHYVMNCLSTMNLSGQAPAAYSLDIAVLKDGRSELIEVQDGWSIGSYGLDGTDYKRFLMARWAEIVNKQLVKA